MFVKYYFVASTLPIKYIFENNKSKKTLIIIKNRDVFESYKYLQKKRKNIKLKLLSKSFIVRIFQLINLIMYYKLKSIKFYFFHECCWPEFDLIIKIFNPISFHIPLVTMNGFKKLEDKSKKISLLQKIKLLCFKLFFYNMFIVYYRKVNFVYSLYFSIKKYPNKIEIKKFNQSKLNQKFKSKSILFLVSREFCDNFEVIKLYQKISNLFKSKGFKIFYKDHPNRNSRLNPKFINMNKINPNKPFELLEKKFDYLIGCGSTPLAYQGKRSICVIKMIKSYEKKKAKYRIDHIKSIYDGKNIFFPSTIKDLAKFVIHKKTRFYP